MTELGNSFSELDLKCDFPAREAFRKALFEHLLALNERKERSATPIKSMDFDESDPEIRELADDELEMLAAARGQSFVPQDWTGLSSLDGG